MLCPLTKMLLTSHNSRQPVLTTNSFRNSVSVIVEPANPDVRRRVFHQVRAAQPVLHARQLIGNDPQCLRCIGQRQKVIQVMAAEG